MSARQNENGRGIIRARSLKSPPAYFFSSAVFTGSTTT